MTDNSNIFIRKDPSSEESSAAIQKWGGLASFILVASMFFSEVIYFSGNLREANGPLMYAVADLLYGPVRAASLVMAVYALRERVGDRAPRLMNLTLMVASLSAVMFVMAAFFRATNRHYHLIHPELHLENSQTVLLVWSTLVTGVIATAWHFFGWALVLLGWAGWTSSRLPRVLSMLYVVIGAAALFVYLLPENEGGVILFGLVATIWQGIVLLRVRPDKAQLAKVNPSQPDNP